MVISLHIGSNSIRRISVFFFSLCFLNDWGYKQFVNTCQAED